MSVIDCSKILSDWTAIVRNQIPPTGSLSNDELENGLRDFLPALDRYIGGKNGIDQAKSDIIKYCKEHGRTRAIIQEYNLSHVILEFQILRKLILKSLKDKKRTTPDIEELVLETIDRGIIGASVEFTLLRGLTENRLTEALIDKTEAIKKLTEAVATITGMGAESEARQNFISALGHDLRNPLTAARLSAQLIKRATVNTQILQEHADRIILCLDRTDRMIRDLLDSQRIKSGEPMPLKKTKTEINKILREEIEELKTLFGDRFHLNETNEVIASVDVEALRRIVENLCTNAVKYGQSGGLITTTLLEHDNNFEIKVHNIGNSISELDQKNIFQQFKRTLSAIESANVGWGIGLTVVKGLTEAHGGRVKVESFPEKGTTFSVIFPK